MPSPGPCGGQPPVLPKDASAPYAYSGATSPRIGATTRDEGLGCRFAAHAGHGARAGVRVAHGAGCVVARGAVLRSDVFGRGDLEAAYLGANPDRLEHGIADAGVENALHPFRAEIMFDARNGLLREAPMQDPVQFDDRGELMAERPCDQHSPVGGAAAEPRPAPWAGEKRGRIRIIPVPGAPQVEYFAQCLRIRRTVVIEAASGACPEFSEMPAGLRDAIDRTVEFLVTDQAPRRGNMGLTARSPVVPKR
jgi:hypothetical protein